MVNTFDDFYHNGILVENITLTHDNVFIHCNSLQFVTKIKNLSVEIFIG